VTTPDVAAIIDAHCDADAIDLDKVDRESIGAGNDVIPIVEQIIENVARSNPTAASFVHYGATSQDVIDTALMLQLRDVVALFDEEMRRLVVALARLAVVEAETPMAARTWMQHASPTSFGFKVAGWLDGVHRAHKRVCALYDAIVLQFGGAVGTLAAFGPRAQSVAQAFSVEIGLPLPAIAWHSTRDRIGEVATTLGLLTATLGKIARDVSLMAQSEVDELREPNTPGRGRSSTMPQKHNPIACAAILAAAVRTPGLVATILAGMVQEHERALGGWQAEWEVIPQICMLAFEALDHTTTVISGLEVRHDRMTANLDVTNGLIFAEALTFALTPTVGRRSASELTKRAIQRAAAERRHLRDVIQDDLEIRGKLSKADIDAVFDPTRYLGIASETIQRVADAALTDIAVDLITVPLRDKK
jgi:3-carboxy-cis,cis-muconate cycloisomerase